MRGDDWAALTYLTALFMVIVCGLGAAVATWLWAPQVGGAWWLYIRMAATIVAAVIGAKVGFIGTIAFGIAAVIADGLREVLRS